MIETPRIVETEARDAAVIRLTIPRTKMQEVFPLAVEELTETLDEQGIPPAGPVFAHHLRMSPETFDLEVGFPVADAVTESGRVKPGELPGATVARTVYHGPYDGLPEARGEFDAWMREHGHQRAPDLRESYVKGPVSGANPADWRTELNRPLLD